MSTKTEKKEKVEKPSGPGWCKVSGNHWERTVEKPDSSCGYCGCTTFVESTYSWPYCADCKGT